MYNILCIAFNIFMTNEGRGDGGGGGRSPGRIYLHKTYKMWNQYMQENWPDSIITWTGSSPESKEQGTA